jgi:hypothetical protein
MPMPDPRYKRAAKIQGLIDPINNLASGELRPKSKAAVRANTGPIMNQAYDEIINGSKY